jgi:pilus assembly protein Flp/PilA
MKHFGSFMKAKLIALHREDSGQDMIEYALIAALIALGSVVGMGFVASQINSGFSLIGNLLVNSI